MDGTRQAKTNDEHNTAMLKQSLENLLTTAKQQQDQLAQDAKTLEETKAFAATGTADREQKEKS